MEAFLEILTSRPTVKTEMEQKSEGSCQLGCGVDNGHDASGAQWPIERVLETYPM